METVSVSGVAGVAVIGKGVVGCSGTILDSLSGCRGVLDAGSPGGVGLGVKLFFEPFGPIDWEMDEAAPRNLDCEFNDDDTITFETVSFIFVDFTKVTWKLRGGEGSMWTRGACLALGYTWFTLKIAGTTNF